MKGSYCSLSLVDGRLEGEWGPAKSQKKTRFSNSGSWPKGTGSVPRQRESSLTSCCWPKLRFSGAFNANKIANTRSIFDFSAENAKVADCLAERDEFEPSVPLVPPAKGGIVPGLHSPLENPTRSDAG